MFSVSGSMSTSTISAPRLAKEDAVETNVQVGTATGRRRAQATPPLSRPRRSARGHRHDMGRTEILDSSASSLRHCSPVVIQPLRSTAVTASTSESSIAGIAEGSNRSDGGRPFRDGIDHPLPFRLPPSPFHSNFQGGRVCLVVPPIADRPRVSVVMPVRNEGPYLRRSLGAVLRQDTQRTSWRCGDHGGSDDATVDIAHELGAATGVVPRAPQPAPDDRSPSTSAFRRRRAPSSSASTVTARLPMTTSAAASGPPRLVQPASGDWETVGETDVARSISRPPRAGSAWATWPTESGRSGGGPADTVPFGAWPRAVFDQVGTFDEELVRNQDDEFNFRTIQAGGVVWFDPTIRSRYYSRASLPRLWRQYFDYGAYKVRVARRSAVASRPLDTSSPQHSSAHSRLGSSAASRLADLLQRSRCRRPTPARWPWRPARRAETVRTRESSRRRSRPCTPRTDWAGGGACGAGVATGDVEARSARRGEGETVPIRRRVPASAIRAMRRR